MTPSNIMPAILAWWKTRLRICRFPMHSTEPARGPGDRTRERVHPPGLSLAVLVAALRAAALASARGHQAESIRIFWAHGASARGGLSEWVIAARDIPEIPMLDSVDRGSTPATPITMPDTATGSRLVEASSDIGLQGVFHVLVGVREVKPFRVEVTAAPLFHVGVLWIVAVGHDGQDRS